MNHSLDDLLSIVYRHHPRNLSPDDPLYAASEEILRLSQARRLAGENAQPWRALLKQLRETLPGITVQNRSLDLRSGGAGDASYSGALHLPCKAGEHVHLLGFLVSILVPYYIVYSSRIVDEPAQEPQSSLPRMRILVEHDTCIALPIDAETDEAPRQTRRRDIVSFDFTPDEEPHATTVARAIEATFGHERMPPEIGQTIVPDVAIGLRRCGEATLYHCLFSEQW